jgi:hypothetical protein
MAIIHTGTMIATILLAVQLMLPCCSSFALVNGRIRASKYVLSRYVVTVATPPLASPPRCMTRAVPAAASQDNNNEATATTTATTKLREDIELMRQEATERLHKLENQMRELQRQQHDLKEYERRQVKYDRIVQKQEILQEHQQQKKGRMEEEEEKDEGEHKERHEEVASRKQAKERSTARTTAIPTATSSLPPSRPAAAGLSSSSSDRYERLDGTRWKLGFNLGREPGTWMPPGWGASGSRLYFEIVVDFLDDPSLEERDEFFLGRAGCKKLRVLDAWMFPTGTGTDSRGRRAIQVSEHGTYKVLPGQGPRGTDIVRFCLDVADDGVVHDDVTCPAGRIYGTCGYFAMDDGGGFVASGATTSASAYKDELAAKQRDLASQYEQLKLEDEQDPNLVHKIGRMREIYQLRKQLDAVAQELQHARQAHPDRSELRFSRDRRVALSREGGVCRKVQKGLAVEYHILGRVEVASIRADDAALDHDEYRDLVKDTLHP